MTRRTLRRGGAAATLALALAGPLAGPLAAQRVVAPPRATPVLRADVLHEGGATSLQGGVGIVVPAGYQVRVALEGGVGATARDGAWQPSGRLDATARFLFDPFREARWALSVGGGAGMRWERGAGPRPVGIVLLGLQGPARDRRWLRGAEVALGGGVRFGLVLARPAPGRR